MISKTRKFKNSEGEETGEILRPRGQKETVRKARDKKRKRKKTLLES